MVTAARISTYCLQLPSRQQFFGILFFVRWDGTYLGKLTVVSCEIAMRRATMGMYSEIWAMFILSASHLSQQLEVRGYKSYASCLD